MVFFISIFTRLMIIIIKFYQKYISIYTSFHCRFIPTCSCYAIIVLKKYGLTKGIYFIIIRLLKCNSLHPGGYDL